MWSSARALLGGALAAALAAASGASIAQDAWPQKPLRIVQGFAAGGNGDTVARIVAEPLARALGQSVLVEAKTGAGGNIASEAVARSAPDGYTLVLFTGGHAVSAGLYRSLPFHPVDDFAMISTVTFFPFVISVRPDHPAKSLADLLRLAKEKPGALNYSSVGVGSTQHLAGELLCAMAGIRMQHVPYRGGTAPIEGLLRGDVDVLIDTVTFTTGQLKAGRARALAVTSPAEWPALPGVAPVAETLAGYDVRSWTGLAAPKGTPAAIIARLNQEVRRGLAQPEVKGRLEALGNEVRASTPDEMRDFVAAQAAKWTRVVRDAGIPQQ